MRRNDIPHFSIKNNFQKDSKRYSDIITKNILDEICDSLTGTKDYTVNFIPETNVGRLATLAYKEQIFYITFGETDYIKGRNSAVQSVPSAITQYFFDNRSTDNKQIFYYFLDSVGNKETDYLFFTYRLLKTIGVDFLNEEKHLSKPILPFNSVNDIITSREYLKKNQNNSSFVTINSEGVIEIFAKTYGANKKEATMLCLAIAKISMAKITVYEMIEHNLNQLPKPDVEVMKALGVEFIRADRELEKVEYETDNSLRSPKFILNMLIVRGKKKCALCNCEIPQLIDGAHIWPVASIKKETTLSFEERLDKATDGNNGIWLCKNHHKLFDSDIIRITKGKKTVALGKRIDRRTWEYIRSITTKINISNILHSEKDTEYLLRRYQTM